jgi:hypothetical protein
MDDIDLGLEERPEKVKGGLTFIVFLIGIAIGVTGTLLAPRYLSPYLPAGLGGGGETLEGPVLGKRQEEGRLLLTVAAVQGAVLATFSERVAEIDLLVDVGDTITLGVTGYEPFIDDPAFRGVRKAAQAPALARPPATEPGTMIEGAPEGVPPATDRAAAAAGSGDQEAADAGTDAAPLGLPRSDPEEAAGDTLQP